MGAEADDAAKVLEAADQLLENRVADEAIVDDLLNAS
jgi:hypothetical protein